MAAVRILLISIFPRQITYTMDFTYVKRSRALKPLDQDPKALVPLLKREQQFILIWLGSGCLWSYSKARSSLQMLWMISYVACILHLVRRDEHHSLFRNEKNLFKDGKSHFFVTFCVLVSPVTEEGCTDSI